VTHHSGSLFAKSDATRQVTHHSGSLFAKSDATRQVTHHSGSWVASDCNEDATGLL